MIKVLITGDKGFVGQETSRYLGFQGIEVVGFDLMDGFDIRDAVQLENVIVRTTPNRILHLAAIARFSDADKDPKLAFETNVLGSLNVSRLAQKFHIPTVYSSTGSVYMPIKQTPPITESFEAKGNSVYGCTKYIGETFIKELTPHIILRYAHLYGSEKRGHGLIGGFVERISRGLAPQLYGGKQSNDFTYVKDIARANFVALTSSWDKWNSVYNIGTGEEISAEKAGEIICKITGWSGGIEKQEARTVDPERFAFDCSKAKNLLGFQSEFNFEKGLEDMKAEGGFIV